MSGPAAPARRGRVRAPPATEGEAWSRAALADLSDAGYGPRAWRSFLAESLGRSVEDARRCHRIAREAVVWCAGGALVWAGLVAVDLRAAGGLAWWTLVSAMLLAHLGMVEGPAGEPRCGLGLANGLTLLRAWLVPLPALLTAEPAAFVAILAVAGAADALDGPLARRRGEVTRLGAQADAGVDVFLAVVAAWAAAAAGWLPVWIAVLVALRYLAPPLLIAVVYLVRAAAPAREAIVRGRYPGVLVACGLALAPIADDRLRVAATALVVVGLAGGAITFAASILRVARAPG